MRRQRIDQCDADPHADDYPSFGVCLNSSFLCPARASCAARRSSRLGARQDRFPCQAAAEAALPIPHHSSRIS